MRFFLTGGRTLRRYAVVWLSSLLLTAPVVAEPSVDCSGVFTDGINSHDFGLIDFGHNAQLIGSPDASLRAGRIKSNNGSRLKTCDTRDCDIENRAGAKISQDPFPDFSVPKKNDLTLNWQESGTLGLSGNRYDRVDTNSRTELSVSSEYSTYYIKRLSLGHASTLNLVAGDYYIERLSTNSEVTINVVGEGTARLFVKERLQFGHRVLVNSPGVDQGGDVSKLLLVGYDEIRLNNLSTVSGAVYAFGDVRLNSPAYLYGAVSAREISLNTDARIYYGSGVGEACGESSTLEVSHFRIYHPASALTCQASSSISVLACANESCTNTVDEPIPVSLNPSGGWRPGNDIELVGEQDLSLRITTPTTVALGLQAGDVEVKGAPGVRCYLVGSEQPSDCQLQFADSGFLIGEGRTLNAGAPSLAVPVSAVRKDNQAQACVPAFANVTRPVRIGADPITPSAANASVLPPVLVNSRSVALAEDDSETIALTFDETGTTYLNLHYSEAGSFNLDLLYEGEPGTEDEGLEMIGQGEFVSIPAGFCIRATGARECNDAYDSCDAFTSAGSPFELTVEAMRWQRAGEVDQAFCTGNVRTRNFTADLALAHSLVAPVVPGQGGQLGSDQVALADGFGALADQSFSEVGVIRVSVPPGQNYLGTSLPGSASGVIGRFFPHRFEVSLLDPGVLGTPAASGTGCGTSRDWTYTGEPFPWELTPEWRITPLNANDSLVRNYTGTDFQKLVADDVDVVPLPTRESAQKDLNGDPLMLHGTWQPGELQADGRHLLYRFSTDDSFHYIKSPSTRLPPFTPQPVMTLQRIEDSDGVSGSGLPEDFQPGADSEIRYGRISLGNTYGPETSALNFPVTVEVLEPGGRFSHHFAESCLALSASDFSISDMPTEDFTSLTLSAGVLSEGRLNGNLGAPGAGNVGTIGLTLDLSETPWLRGLWTSEETFTDPESTATFGVYRGHDRVIYWREVVN